MTGDDGYKLVYLRVTKAEGQVEAYTAKLPPGPALPAKLEFGAPIKIADYANSRAAFLPWLCTPVYHSGKEEIGWAVNADHEGKLSFWRIGKHLALVAREETSLSEVDSPFLNPAYKAYSEFINIPSVIAQGGYCLFWSTLHIRMEGHVLVLKDSMTGVCINEGETKELNVKRSRAEDHVLSMSRPYPYSCLVFGSALDTEAKYTYTLRWSAADVAIFLDTLNSDQLLKTKNDKAIMWQTFQLDNDWGRRVEPLAQIITINQATKRQLLYLFRLNLEGQRIDFTIVKLRKDGSVDSHIDVIKVDTFKISLSGLSTTGSSFLKVVDLGDQRRVLLGWETGNSCRGLVANVNEEGLLPTTAEGWKTTEIKFDPSLEDTAPGSKCPFAAVVVPASFAEY